MNIVPYFYSPSSHSGNKSSFIWRRVIPSEVDHEVCFLRFFVDVKKLLGREKSTWEHYDRGEPQERYSELDRNIIFNFGTLEKWMLSIKNLRAKNQFSIELFLQTPLNRKTSWTYSDFAMAFADRPCNWCNHSILVDGNGHPCCCLSEWPKASSIARKTCLAPSSIITSSIISCGVGMFIFALFRGAILESKASTDKPRRKTAVNARSDPD